ncbi:MAG: hypothetical protein CMJ23_05080 [Phycisphaerae bacterium]|nr:hypothetical protein [Phycisphaerae bacterium]
MRSRIIRIAAAVGVAFLASCHSTPEPSSKATMADANPQFERVKSMIGDWYLVDAEPGDAPTATYRLSANETAVVERLFPGQRKEMVTMYFIDDGRLKLTHFCALGNQPSMGAIPGDDDVVEFEFIGITNLAAPTAQHMHEHVLEFTDDRNRVDSTWVLWNDGSEAERRFFPLERRAMPLQ